MTPYMESSTKPRAQGSSIYRADGASLRLASLGFAWRRFASLGVASLRLASLRFASLVASLRLAWLGVTVL